MCGYPYRYCYNAHMRVSIKILITFLLLCIGAIPVSVSAVSFDSHGTTAQPGMLMSLTRSSGVAEPTTDKNAALLVGIYTDETSLDTRPGQVNVKTNGQTTALVSTLHGEIRVGDRIGPSSLAGIGARVDGKGWVVGVAQGSLDATTSDSVSVTIEDSRGSGRKVRVGRIPVLINVTYIPDATNNADSRDLRVPNFLQELANTIAGKHVTLLGLIMGFTLMLLGLAFACFLAYGAARGGLQAISRQPLSKAVITRRMLHSFAIAGGILVAGLVCGLLLMRFL